MSSQASLVIPAFIAGVLTFFAPCTFPLVPAYLGYLGGTAGDLRAERGRRAHLMLNALLFVAGFTLVFTILGTAAGFAGNVLVRQRETFSRIGGVMVLLFGLAAIADFDLAKIPFLREKRLKTAGRKFGAFAFGTAFAFTWTPCVGPVLASVLLLAASTTAPWSGALLLMVFAFGIAVPFLALTWGADHVLSRVQALSRRLRTISFVGGVFMVILGLLMITGDFVAWAGFAGRFINFLGIEKYIVNFL